MTTTRRNLVLAAVAVVVVLAAIAVALAGGDDEPAADAVAEVGEPAVSGAALPELTDPNRDPAVGAPAPVATGEDFAGDPAKVGGEPKLIAFVAHWCPHCQAEVPRLVEWMQAGDLEPGDIDLVSTSVDEAAPNYPPSAWLAEERWDGEVLLDSADGDVARAYGVSAFPFFVAVDGDGEVTARVSGELTLEQVQALLATVG